MKSHLVVAAVAFVAGLAVSLGQGEPRAQPAGISREMLRRVDLPELPGWQIAFGRATLAPGASAGRHTHPGAEVGIVVAGTARFELEGQPSVTLVAGDTFHAPTSNAHDAVNTGTTPATALSCWVVPKDKPFAAPAP